MERIKWTEKIKNADVLERVGEGRTMRELINKRKRNWLIHWLRRNCLLKDALDSRAGVFNLLNSRFNLHLSYKPAGRSHCRLQNHHGYTIKHNHRDIGGSPGDVGEVPMK